MPWFGQSGARQDLAGVNRGFDLGRRRFAVAKPVKGTILALGPTGIWRMSELMEGNNVLR